MGDQEAEVQRILRDVLAPLIKADGGELYLAKAEPRAVTLHLAGKFSGCPGTSLAATEFVHQALHKADAALEVSVTSGPIIPQQAERLC